MAELAKVACCLLLSVLISGAGQKNIVGTTDDRKPITEVQKELGFSDAEIRQARACTGVVSCPTNAISGTSVVHPDLIITAKHIFLDDQGDVEPGIEKCVFFSYTNRKKRIRILIDRVDLTAGEDPERDLRYDYVIARLEHPLADCTPYILDERAKLLKVGDEIISIASPYQEHMAPNFPHHSPVAQRCHVRDVTPPVVMSGLPGFHSNDCDAHGGASGSIVLTRIDGRLTAKSLLVRSGKAQYDYAPYKRALSSSTGVDLNGSFLYDLLRK